MLHSTIYKNCKFAIYSKIIKPQITSFAPTNSKMIWKYPIMIVIEAFRISEIYRPLCQRCIFTKYLWEIFSIEYYKCKHQSAERNLSVINISTPTTNMYGVFSSMFFRLMSEDSTNNRIWEHWSFTRKYSVGILCMNSIIKDSRCISL